MDIHKHLILIRKEDKTRDIQFCNYENGKWQITFHGNPKTYSYNYPNVLWEQDPLEINSKHYTVYIGDQQISNLAKILKFNDYYRLIYQSGFTKIYHHSAIQLEQSSLANKNTEHIFHYLAEIADQTGRISPNEPNFLSNEYKKITHISPRSFLSHYLSKEDPLVYKRKEELIFPFGLNQSQKKATENAFSNQLSIIEGPPGTGKTQTILNIIANAMMNNQTVAVVSNNNAATLNIVEKLAENELDFFTAFLGNRKNQEAFIEKQSANLPDMSQWKLDRENKQAIRTELTQSQKKLDQMLSLLNKQAKLKEELSAISTEFTHFKEDYLKQFTLSDVNVTSFYTLTAKRLMQLLIHYQSLIENGKISLLNKLNFLFRYGIYYGNFYKQDPESVITWLQKKYYKKRQVELETEIKELEQQLANYKFDKAIERQSNLSMKLFKDKLANKYKSRTNKRPIFSTEDLWRNFNQFVNEYPIILSTTHSLRNSGGRHHLFDYILVDEASQVDIVSGALALSSAKNAVIVGDLMQLPHVVPQNIAEATDFIFKERKVDYGYHYARQSLLSSVHTLFPRAARTLLKEHYRCHPKIIGYCNKKYYDGELIVLTEENDRENPLILYETVKGNHARDRINERQVDVIYNEIIPDQEINPERETVGIIAPYRDQANLLNKRKPNDYIEADTVHKYQGQERDIIILSTVNNDINYNDFADQPNLINVAVSRAIDQLIVVTAANSETWQETNIGDLVRYIKYNNFEVIKSDIRSIFDLLYKDYSAQLIKTLEENKQVSKHKSENLMNIVIKKVLQRPGYEHLHYVLHQPLRMLLRDKSKLTEEEKTYALNILTHTDFVIYNKIDKMPVLVIEVDGHAYHAANPKQRQRDEMKDTILNKYKIPYIRMKTTGSEEEEKLMNKLEEVLT